MLTDEERRERNRVAWRVWRARNLERDRARCRARTARVKRSPHTAAKMIMQSQTRRLKVSQSPRHESQLGIEDVIEIIQRPCAYCGFVDPTGLCNGIDRVDNELPYTVANIAPCCAMCNVLKGTLRVDEFKKLTSTIASVEHSQFPRTVGGIGYNTRPACFSGIRRGAARRGLAFEITRDEWRAITELPCMYCNRPNRDKGLDRLNNNVGYTSDNVTSACGRCNMARKTFPVTMFLDRCAAIAAHTHGIKGCVLLPQSAPNFNEFVRK